MRLDEWLRHATTRLDLAGVDSPRLEAQVLAAHVLRVDRSWLIAHPGHDFPEAAGEALLQRREAHEPLAYLTGYREFRGREFGVDPSVLIPRHETEELVEAALDLSSRPPLQDNPLGEGECKSVLDLGTGSGILAVTLKLERPDWEVTAVDISPEALATASANARFHGANVRFVLSDGFAALLGESFDLIVSNPPYIGNDEELSAEVRDHEPAGALFSGPTGLEFYERLAREAPAHLEDSGLILLEVGHTQASIVRALFEGEGWKHETTRRDLSGVERVVAFRWSYDCAA
jgi:release factor glutamine methyltransferase